MKLFIKAMEDGSVSGISTVNGNGYIEVEISDDEAEIALRSVEFARLQDGVLIYDEGGKQAVTARRAVSTRNSDIARLKSQLTATDYKAIKYAEGQYTDAEYAETRAAREALREQIRTLEE